MKKWYQSKTLWFNIITIILGTVEVISNTYTIPANTLFLINGIGNMILRVITSKKIDV